MSLPTGLFRSEAVAIEMIVLGRRESGFPKDRSWTELPPHAWAFNQVEKSSTAGAREDPEARDGRR